jgi:recombinational DNA repair protein (RecF pathway)
MHIEAVVIRKTPAREHDQLLTLYGRQTGKLTAIARGSLRANSRQAPALDEANLITGELVAGRGAAILIGAQASRCFAGVKRAPLRWAAVQFFLQVVDTAVYDEQPDEQVWNALTGAIGALETVPGENILREFRRWQDALLTVLGYGRQDPAATLSVRAIRTPMDETYERIAQRRLGTIDFFYHLVGTGK